MRGGELRTTMQHEHRYASTLEWTGNTGTGYSTYDRTHTIRIPGKADLITTSHPDFLGDPNLHDPEDLLLAALSSCHLLTYLALCARARIAVTRYLDRATGTLITTPEGGGRFVEAVLHPEVVIADAAHLDKAHGFHAAAHTYCFIANSVNFPVRAEPVIRVG